ncbi:hypothetical protein ACFYYS_18575 [Streptomyces sp. NPDC002120]|uniref:hypothetical protein n=1 Tax=Streptomyces sp. NPDC002120 TaxID=3364631 RepID=UPI0036B48BD5
MKDTRWWTGGRLLAAAVCLACTGSWLLSTGITRPTGGARSAAPAVVTPMVPADAAPASGISQPSPSGEGAVSVPSSELPDVAPRPGGSQPVGAAERPAAAEPGRPAAASELPPPGSGPGADPLIQQALDHASPSDLPPATAQHLVSAGRTAWLAETAGYTQVRIQAATARRDAAAPAGREAAVVRLVWAGADRAGTFLDGRTAAVHFTHNGEGSWDRTL